MVVDDSQEALLHFTSSTALVLDDVTITSITAPTQKAIVSVTAPSITISSALVEDVYADRSHLFDILPSSQVPVVSITNLHVRDATVAHVLHVRGSKTFDLSNSTFAAVTIQPSHLGKGAITVCSKCADVSYTAVNATNCTSVDTPRLLAHINATGSVQIVNVHVANSTFLQGIYVWGMSAVAGQPNNSKLRV